MNWSCLFANKIFATSFKTVGTIRAFFIKSQQLDLDTVALYASRRVKFKRNSVKYTSKAGAKSLKTSIKEVIDVEVRIGSEGIAPFLQM